MARDIQIKIGARDAASGVFRKVSTSAGSLRSELASLKPAFVAIGASATAAAAGVGLFLKESISTASDAQEVWGKFGTVFGDNAADMEKWSNANAEAMGTSRQEMAEMLSGLQDLFVPLGVATDEATEMSKSVANLAIDLGSFNNMRTEDVIRDLQAALTGSSETVKKYGVIVDMAATKQELLNMKLDSATATNAQKAQARLNIILRDTTAAQGDAIRTAGSFANQTKRLEGAWTDFKNVIGSGFLEPLADLLGGFRETLQGITREIEDADWGGAMRLAMLKMKLELVRGLQELRDFAKDFGPELLRTMAQDQINLATGGQLPGGVLDSLFGGGPSGGLDQMERVLARELRDALKETGTDAGVGQAATDTGEKIGAGIADGIKTGIQRKYKKSRRETLIELGFDPDDPLIKAGADNRGGRITGRQVVRLQDEEDRQAMAGALMATQGRLLGGGFGSGDPKLDEAKKQNKKLTAIDENLKINNDLTRRQVDGERDRPSFRMEPVV